MPQIYGTGNDMQVTFSLAYDALGFTRRWGGGGGGYFGTAGGGAHSVKCTVSNASSSSTSPLLAPLWVADYGSMRGAGGKCFGPADGPLPTGS